MNTELSLRQVHDSINYPSISVIIPSFNQGQYIEETILSIIGQYYPNLEILILDGGSTDNTVEVIEKYGDKITYWHSKKDDGQADAINHGIRLSSGDIICWLNSDDMYLPGTLLDVGKRFANKTNENYLIYGPCITIEQNNEKMYSSVQNNTPFDSFRLSYNDFISQPSTFWTRKLWQSTGELNTSYNYVLDWDWFIRASKITDFEYVPRCYSLYRFHDLHKTSYGGIKRRKEIIDMVEKYSSEYWLDLYITVNKNYEKILEKTRILKSLKIPRRQLLLPILVPGVGLKIKRMEHLVCVMNMLHFPNN